MISTKVLTDSLAAGFLSAEIAATNLVLAAGAAGVALFAICLFGAAAAGTRPQLIAVVFLVLFLALEKRRRPDEDIDLCPRWADRELLTLARADVSTHRSGSAIIFRPGWFIPSKSMANGSGAWIGRTFTFSREIGVRDISRFVS